MVLKLEPKAAPIRFDTHGVARIADTRVPLETVIQAFCNGDTSEQIVDSFDVLGLADVYAVIAYYLSHRDEVDAYMREANAEAEQVRQELTSTPEAIAWRERLLARKREMQS